MDDDNVTVFTPKNVIDRARGKNAPDGRPWLHALNEVETAVALPRRIAELEVRDLLLSSALIWGSARQLAKHLGMFDLLEIIERPLDAINGSFEEIEKIVKPRETP